LLAHVSVANTGRSRTQFRRRAAVLPLTVLLRKGAAQGNVGGEDCPSELMPQQVTRSSIWIAQVLLGPAVIALKVPEGGEDC
jgi:hypothetical protein